jgi:excisionase family DNA binding protein
MGSSATQASQLMDVNQLAERLGVQVRYVRRLVAERRIPYVKLGHLVRFDRADVEKWIDRARVEACDDLRF